MSVVSFEFEAIGTHWKIDLDPGGKDLEEIQTQIKSRIEIFDKTYSRFREDSLVAQISKESGKTRICFVENFYSTFYLCLYFF
jgi:thiamine biosynthesis lipoprotein